MWLMLQQNEPGDYVVGTGESHSVREFVEKVLEYVKIDLEWKDIGINEKGVVRSYSPRWDDVIKPGDVVIEIDPRYFRPTEVEFLQANIMKARQKLGWEPRMTFDELIKMMVDYDMRIVGFEPVGEGIRVCEERGFTYTNHDFSLFSNSTMIDR